MMMLELSTLISSSLTREIKIVSTTRWGHFAQIVNVMIFKAMSSDKNSGCCFSYDIGLDLSTD